MVCWQRLHHKNCCVDRKKRKKKKRLGQHLHRDLYPHKCLFLVNRLPYTSFNMMASV